MAILGDEDGRQRPADPVLTTEELYFYGVDGRKLGTYLPQFSGSPTFTTNPLVTDLQVYFGGRQIGHYVASTYNPMLALTPSFMDRLGSARNAAGTFGGQPSNYFPYGEDKGTAAGNDQVKFAT